MNPFRLLAEPSGAACNVGCHYCFFLKKHGVGVNVVRTIHAASAEHLLDVYRVFRDELGAKYIQQEGSLVTERTVKAEAFGRLGRYADESRQLGAKSGATDEGPEP